RDAAELVDRGGSAPWPHQLAGQQRQEDGDEDDRPGHGDRRPERVERQHTSHGPLLPAPYTEPVSEPATSPAGHAPVRPVLVVDFGAQYAQLIARRVREARVYSEVIAHSASVEEMKARDPAAIVLSGGPASVYAEGAPQLDPALFDLGVPVFGICYGFQAMAQALGGTVARTGTSEYGRTELKVAGGELHSGLPETQPVWMSHGDAVTSAPQGFEVVATTAGAPVAAFENRARELAGVQYHPEVMHTPHGQQVLRRFLHEFAG